MPGIHLDHVSVVTADLDRFTRFLEHTIGLRLVAVDHSPRNGFRRLGAYATSTGVAVLALERPGFDLADECGEYGAVDHVAFRADGDDFDDVVDRLVAVGASSGEVESDGPTRAVRFVDPDGRSWRLCRPDPDWSPPASVDVVACATFGTRETSS